MSKSFAEASEEFDEAVRELGRVVGDAIEGSRGFRLFVRFAEWADAKVPALRWLDDRAPAWLKFPSWAFFEALGTVYLGVVIGGVIWYYFFQQSG